MRAVGQLAIAAVALCAASCGQSRAPLPEPLLFGHGPQYHPPAYGRAVASAKPIGALSCERAPGRTRFLAHVEVIAHGRVALVPSGIGIAPPHVRRGAYVARGRCEYALRTHEPTGLIEVAARGPVTLGTFFGVWRQPLSRRRLLGFAAGPGREVAAFIGARRWVGDPRAIPLRRHTAVTLEVGRRFPPRPGYAFPRGP